MKMRLLVEPAGKTTATVVLTQEQVDAIRGVPGKARVMLAITYGGTRFQTSISIYRGQWMMVVNQSMRAGGLEPGHSYDVEIAVDTEERTVEIPSDLQAALKGAGVEAAFAKLSFTNRKEFVRGITEAKKQETRDSRIAKCIASLQA